MKRTAPSFSRALILAMIAILITTMPVFAAVLNPGAMVPVPSGSYARYSQGPHASRFPSTWVTNSGQIATSSIDLGYSGVVVAPIAGMLAIAKDCGDHQVAFIRAPRGTDGYGWAIGLVHIYVNPAVRNTNVLKGQVIGKTVPPLAAPGKGCGVGAGSHIHFTLMKWRMNPSPRYTEQNIVNTYLGKWIVKNTFLDGPTNDIPLGGLIK